MGDNLNAVELVKTLKKAALDAMESSKPVNICFGKVKEISPLKIAIEQKMTLGEKQLILTRSVTDYKTFIKKTPTAEKEEITICNGLVVDDEVILLRQQKGQKYLVLDRIGT